MLNEEDMDITAPRLKHIRRFFSEFKDVSEESRFRQEMLTKHRRLAFNLFVVIALAMPLFILSDHMVTRSDQLNTFLLVQRLLQVLSCFVALFLMRKIRLYAYYDILVFGFLFVFFVLVEVGSYTFADDYALYVIFDIIILMSLYASGMLSVKLSLVLCLGHTFVAIVIVLFVKKLEIHEQIMVIIGYCFSNGAGIILAISHHKIARQEFSLKQSLSEKTLQLKQLAYRDSLTNALNRRAFQNDFSDFQRMAARVKSDQKSLFLIAADIDHFKSINDSFGHDIGDKVLVAFTKLVESQLRPQDRVYRFGGEEFMILLQDCHSEIAIQSVERIMGLLNQGSLGVEELDGLVLCSFGITPILIADTVDSVCIRADGALYTAKNNGRNQYVFDLGEDVKPK